MTDENMFCFQCEQTAGCTACTGAAGVCGKTADVARLQDELTGALIALARAENGGKVGDKSWDNLKNFFQTQGFEFLFLSQSARRVAFGGSMAPKTPVLKLNRPFARKPPAAIASELTRVACAPFAKPQVAGLRHS